MIRSLTIGIPLGAASQIEIGNGARHLISTARSILSAHDIAPRTFRYTLPAVGPEGEDEGVVQSLLRWVDSLAAETDVRWYCLPFDFVSDALRTHRLETALDIVSRFPRLFMNLIVSDERNLSVPAINDVALLVSRIARKSNNGFDNFRVGASCGCPANAPFFPFSRHEGERIAFSFALETTGLALAVADEFAKAAPIDSYRDRLVERLSEMLARVHELGLEIERNTDCLYRGLDASLAPFPDGRMSVAGLIAQLLGAEFGSQGSVFITGVLTDALRAAIERSGARAVGFNGVMFSLLEDNMLAAANSRRHMNFDSLMAASAVCGCGIDMVPVSGTSFPEEIAAVMLDIAAMAISLRKPLGVRLLPIPNRAANEFTNFNMEFLCDSRILSLAGHDRSLTTHNHAFGLLSPRVLPR